MKFQFAATFTLMVIGVSSQSPDEICKSCEYGVGVFFGHLRELDTFSVLLFQKSTFESHVSLAKNLGFSWIFVQKISFAPKMTAGFSHFSNP